MPYCSQELYNALATLVYCKEVSDFLAENDPKALEQANNALTMFRRQHGWGANHSLKERK